MPHVRLVIIIGYPFSTPTPLGPTQLAKRKERREDAEKSLKAAEDAGDSENVERFQKRLVKVTRQHNDECKRLLGLMGVPYVEVSVIDY